MIRLLAAISISAIALSSSLSYAQNVQSITWFEFDAPPYYILDGVYKNRGTSQQFQKDIIDSLSNYQHKIQRGNFVRGLTQIAEQNNVCSVSLLKSKEYEGFTHFSKPWFQVLSIGINIKRDELSKFSPAIDNGKIDLEKLMTRTDIRLGVLRGRPYGAHIDKVLTKYKNSPRIFEMAGNAKMKNLLHAFTKRKQFNAVLGYAAETTYYVNQFNVKTDGILYFPIKNSVLMFQAHVGCSKSPLGNTVIEQVNKIIDTTPAEVFEQRYFKFISSETQQSYLRIKKQLAQSNLP